MYLLIELKKLKNQLNNENL